MSLSDCHDFYLRDFSHLYKYVQLLEVTARAGQLVVDWGESGLAVADGLSNLLKVIISLIPINQHL